MLYFITIGTVLGLSAGFAPGPLLTLVISETIQHNVKSGVKVAIAPVITDLPIILLTLFLLSRLSGFHQILGLISIAGALFISVMAYNSMLTKASDISIAEVQSKSLTKGVLANILNPHPYLFWVSVGVPMMNKALSISILTLIGFIGSFYICLVGSKIFLAVITGKSKSFLIGNRYIYIIRILGIILGILALFLLYDGLMLLGIIPD